MSRLVKIVNNKYVQIEEYKNPNICFNTNEYGNFEDYCTLRETFDPFEIFYENQELKERIDKSIRYINNCISSPDIYEQLISRSETKKLLEILTGGDKMKLEKVRNMSDDELRKYLSMFGGKCES